MSEKTLLTVDEVADFLRVAPNTVYRWCRDGKLTGIKIGKEWRIAQTDLDSFLTARTGATAGPPFEALLYRQRSLLVPRLAGFRLRPALRQSVPLDANVLQDTSIQIPGSHPSRRCVDRLLEKPFSGSCTRRILLCHAAEKQMMQVL